MRSLRLPSLLGAILCTSLLAGPVVADHHEAGEAMAKPAATETAAVNPDPWVQEDVAATAEKLSEQIDKLYTLARIENYDNTRTMREVGFLVIEDMKVLRRMSRQLAARLKDGQGKDDTDQIMTRMEITLSNLRVNMVRSPILEDRGPEIAQAQDTMNQMRAYYGITPPDVAGGAPSQPEE